MRAKHKQFRSFDTNNPLFFYSMYHPLKASVAALLIVLFFSAGPLHARINPADKATQLPPGNVWVWWSERCWLLLVVVSEEGKAPRRFRNESLAFMQEEMFAFGKSIAGIIRLTKDKSVLKSPAYHFEIKAAFQTIDTWLHSGYCQAIRQAINLVLFPRLWHGH